MLSDLDPVSWTIPGLLACYSADADYYYMRFCYALMRLGSTFSTLMTIWRRPYSDTAHSLGIVTFLAVPRCTP